jgi:hypothetical protein
MLERSIFLDYWVVFENYCENTFSTDWFDSKLLIFLCLLLFSRLFNYFLLTLISTENFYCELLISYFLALTHLNLDFICAYLTITGRTDTNFSEILIIQSKVHCSLRYVHYHYLTFIDIYFLYELAGYFNLYVFKHKIFNLFFFDYVNSDHIAALNIENLPSHLKLNTGIRLSNKLVCLWDIAYKHRCRLDLVA